MKYIISASLIMLMSLPVLAQSKPSIEETELSAKEKPRFPGGEKGLQEYLSLNLRYPNKALENKIEGEVLVGFQIDEKGSISSVKVAESIGYGCDEEAIRVVKAMPQWHPANIDGKPIKVNYILPVLFELPESDGKADE